VDSNKFYTNFWRKYGALEKEEDRAKIVAWENRKKQLKRFEIATNQIKSGSIMDVGCGLGDFESYLRKQYKAISYHGIDSMVMFIAKARINQFDSHISQMNLFDLTDEYDYIVCLGTFAIGPRMETGIKHLLPLAKKKLILNGIFTTYDKKNPSRYNLYDPIALQKQFGGKIIKVPELPIDFFLVISK